jgi:hypothetical protein
VIYNSFTCVTSPRIVCQFGDIVSLILMTLDFKQIGLGASDTGVQPGPTSRNLSIIQHGNQYRRSQTDSSMDLTKLKPAPDRPRLFMSKSGKVVIVFPNGEIVEGKYIKIGLRLINV